MEIADPTVGETNGWYVLNVQQYGYYRVNYDRANWEALIAQLNTDHTVRMSGGGGVMCVCSVCVVCG